MSVLKVASFKEHCDECVEKLGEPFEKVHRWLDEFFAKLGYDEKHRDLRHHKKGIEEVRKMWGDKAAEAARIHIERDFYGYLPEDSDDVLKWRIGVIHRPGMKIDGGIIVPDKE